LTNLFIELHCNIRRDNILTKHPDLRKSEEDVGFIEPDSRQLADINLLKQVLGIKTARLGNGLYVNDKKVRQLQGICDCYGPYHLFVKKSELARLRNQGVSVDQILKKYHGSCS
jgi:hypothetical protein